MDAGWSIVRGPHHMRLDHLLQSQMSKKQAMPQMAFLKE
jgi:hypothetical protein